MIKTSDITKKYAVTRQTINNWIQEGLLERPQKNEHNAWIWEEPSIKVIEHLSQFKSVPKDQVDTFTINNRRYLGSKFKMLDFIDKVVKENTENVNTVADIFGGTGVVANLFNSQGKKVIVNDILYSNYISYLTWFGNELVDYGKVTNLIRDLNELEGFSGYVSENYGNRYFSIDNAMKIDAIREKIDIIKNINERERSFLLTSLFYAADKVANTVGHYDAYRKKMDSYAPIHLRVPELNFNKGNLIFKEDANELVKHIKADLVYIDTPYNSRGYANAYHVLESLIEWNKPELRGVAKKPVDLTDKRSLYNGVKAPEAFSDLIGNIEAKYILVSYNNMAKKGNSRSNAKISNEEIIEVLKKKGKLTVFHTNHQPFSTGKSQINNHKELLYLCKVN